MSKRKMKIFSKSAVLYIEAIVYILAIVVGVFACNVGNIYIKMLPILFILGFIGRMIFDRPIVTTIFGIITAICITKLTNNASFFDNLFISLCNGLNIALGELLGEYFFKCKKVFNKKNNKKGILTFFSTGVVLIISIGVHIYTNGNYVSYFKAKESLYTYLDENYANQEFEIVKCNYNFYKTNSYKFEMRNITKGINTNFIVISKNFAVYDEYKFVVQSKNNTKINEEFSKYVKDINTDLDFKIGYLNSGDIKLIISKSVKNVDDSQVNLFVSEVNEILFKLFEVNKEFNIANIEISIIDITNNENTLISDFDVNDLKKSNNTYEYIFNSLKVEFIEN